MNRACRDCGSFGASSNGELPVVDAPIEPREVAGVEVASPGRVSVQAGGPWFGARGFWPAPGRRCAAPGGARFALWVLAMLLVLSACASDRAPGQASDAQAGPDAGRDTDAAGSDATSADATDADALAMDTAPDHDVLDVGKPDVAMDTPEPDIDPMCMPSTEVCDGRDNDCDGQRDEDLRRGCESACGAGEEVCVDGRWTACDARQPEAESCDGRDNDCDGVADQGLERSCTTACGGGTEVCRGGVWAACDAPAVEAETCNGRDDDCNGDADDGLGVELVEVARARLRDENGFCSESGTPLDHCLTTAHRYCSQLGDGCYATGFGWLDSDENTRVLCLPHAGRRLRVSYGDLSAAAGFPILDPVFGTRAGLQAVHRYCLQEGFAGGVGPLEHFLPMATIYCIDASAGRVHTVPTADMRARGCDPAGVELHQPVCAGAANDVCRAMGQSAGFGPLEWTPDNTAVFCFR